MTNATTVGWLSESGAGVNATASFSSSAMALPDPYQPFTLTLRRSSNVVRCYLNGVQFGSDSATLTTPDGAATSQLRVNGNGVASFPRIYALKIVASALTDAEVKAEHNRTLGVAYGPLP